MKMETEQVILTRQLPKTGYTYSYSDGDDAYYQAGWWKGRKIADNKTRFIAKTINGDDVVIDRATGLMWAADGAAAGCNNGGTLNLTDAIVYANALDFAGFTDWRLPNINELFSIVKHLSTNPSIYTDFFSNTVNNHYWSSGGAGPGGTYGKTGLFTLGEVVRAFREEVHYLRCVRGGL